MSRPTFDAARYKHVTDKLLMTGYVIPLSSNGLLDGVVVNPTRFEAA